MIPAFLTLLACSEPERPDVARYLEAARLASTDPAAGVAACASVGGDMVQSECLAWAAAELARTDAAAARAVCADIPLEVWRDECSFLVAEETVRSVGAEAAASACASAGQFSDNCLMHIWKGHARALIAERGLAEGAEAYGPALAWADGVIPRDAPLESRFWDLYFDAAMGTPGESEIPLDMAVCDTVKPGLRDRCLRAVPASLQRALNRAERKPAHAPGALDATALCADDTRPLPERLRAATGVQYVPSSALDGVATRFVERRCASPSPGVRP